MIFLPVFAVVLAIDQFNHKLWHSTTTIEVNKSIFCGGARTMIMMLVAQKRFNTITSWPSSPSWWPHPVLMNLFLLAWITSTCLLNDVMTIDEINTNDISTGAIRAYLSRASNNGNCPKSLNCTEGYFDEGKDCYDTNRSRCNCIAHCCLAFDCRDWGHLVQCRRKCGATPNRFGLIRTNKLECQKYACERQFYDPNWDSRDANDSQRNCIAHCCYGLDCRRALGYCRHACGVESWVTPRPLG